MSRLAPRGSGPPSACTPVAATLRVTDFTLGALEGEELAVAREQWRALEAALPASAAPRWRAYLETPRVRLYERQPGQGGFAHGMGAMLVAPARALATFRDCGASVFARAEVTVLGISLPAARSARSSGLPALFVYDPTRLQTPWRPPRDRQDQAMSLPLLLPGWRTSPAGGFHAGWSAISAEPGMQVSTLARWLTDVAGAERAALVALMQFTPSAMAQAGQVLGDADEWRVLEVALEAAEANLARRVVERLMEHLHPLVAQGCMSQRGCLRPAEYNWVAGGATARAWQWRMQALAQFPAFCTSAVLPGLPIEVPLHLTRRSEALRRLRHWAEDDPVRGAYTLSSVVDQGRPLIRDLAQSFRVSPSAVRALRGVGADQAPLLESPPLGWPDLLQTLDAMAPENRPRSSDDWRHFEWLYKQGLIAWRVVHREGIGHGQVFLTQALRPWLARAARDWGRTATRWRDGFRGVEGLQAAAAFAADLQLLWRSQRLNADQRALLVRQFTHAPPPVWQRLVNAHAAWRPPQQAPQRAQPRIAEPAVRPRPAQAELPPCWDDRTRRLVQRFLPEGAATAEPWYKLPDLNTLDLDDLPCIRPLNSAQTLQQEAMAMQHCIATYRADLTLRQRVAFAIGEDGARDRSTVMLDYVQTSSGGWRFEMVQHHSARNRPTSLACRVSVVHLMDELNSERLRPHVDALEQARVQRHEAVRRAMVVQVAEAVAPARRLPSPRQPAVPDAELLAASRAWHALAAVGWLRGEFFGPGPRTVVGEG